MNNLKILFLNVNSIRNKTNELQSLVINHQISIILLNEIHLRPENSLKIPNYYTFRNILSPRGQRPYGGTAILVHRRMVNLANQH